MADAINMVKLVLDVTNRKRGRACVVMSHDYAGQRTWAEQLAQQTGAQHIDLLELFTVDKGLGESLREYSVPRFFSLLRERAKKATLIVSGIEFLKASWSGQADASEQLASRIETWQDDPALVLVMQYDKAIAERPFRRFSQYTFVIDQRETIAL